MISNEREIWLRTLFYLYDMNPLVYMPLVGSIIWKYNYIKKKKNNNHDQSLLKEWSLTTNKIHQHKKVVAAKGTPAHSLEKISSEGQQMRNHFKGFYLYRKGVYHPYVNEVRHLCSLCVLVAWLIHSQNMLYTAQNI